VRGGRHKSEQARFPQYEQPGPELLTGFALDTALSRRQASGNRPL
jgi:hypothetical protein